MKIVILDADTLGQDVKLDVFEELGEVEKFGFTAEGEIGKRIRNADIVVTNKQPMNAMTLKEAEKVKCICVTATGVNNVDIGYCSDRQITVTNVKGYSTDSVAQHTFAMMFYLLEKLSYYDEYVKSGKYINDKMFTHFEKKFTELSGKTWGIIGLGDIGKKVAQLAQAFGCHVVYYSTSGHNHNNQFKEVDLETLLAESHIISIHAPLNEQTSHLIGYNEFVKMKRDAIVINVGRGGIISEADAVRAVEEELIGGLGIDVLEQEPMIENHPYMALQDSTRVLVTPHIAWASYESRQRLVQEVFENARGFINGQSRNVVGQ